MKQAIARAKDLRISFKHSTVLCKMLKGMKLDKAKKFLEDLIDQKVSIDGRYYTKAATNFLQLLKQAEANAKNKNLKIEKLWIKNLKANKARKVIRRGRMGIRHGKGFRLGKSTHLELILVER